MDERRVEEAIKAALDTLGVPVDRLYYDGEAETFITYQLVTGTDAGFMDDESTRSDYLYRVDIYSKVDYMALLRRTKQELRAAGFYEITVDPEIYEREVGYFHIPIEARYTENFIDTEV